MDALIFYRTDAHEVARRARAGAERLDRMDALETLLDLPVGLPVELTALSEGQRSALRRLPQGAAERGRRQVVRRAVRPLSVDLAVVKAAGWRQGLELAGRFAPFCRRAMLLDRLPREREEMLMEASFYGIGVLGVDGSDVQMLLEPAAYRPRRYTAAAWHFIEELYPRLA